LYETHLTFQRIKVILEHILKKILPLFTVILITGCQDNEFIGGSVGGAQVEIEDGTWLINPDYIRNGCFSGKDCIPSLELPEKTTHDNPIVDYLNEEDLVVGVWSGAEYIAYPHNILDWHEIANELGYTISYCPLTGSALHFETGSEFGVSGLLYNNNLIMYDRKSDSYWPQMFLKAANGRRSGEELRLKPMLETTWANWKKLFPNSKILSGNYGFPRDYAEYPYGFYKECNSKDCGDYIYFPIENLDERLKAKTRVIAVNGVNKQKAFVIESFDSPTIINEIIGDIHHSVIISGPDNIAVAYETNNPLKINRWNVENGIILLEDDEGNLWNILGRSKDGSSASLKQAKAFISYWFSQAAFHPNTEIY